MRGDFSKWNFKPQQNFRGLLHQQGRVFLESDLNDQTRIINLWEDQAGQDIIGPDVAGVPADVPDSFKIIEASRNSGTINLSISPGRVWADGLLIYLKEEIKRTATYLQPPAEDDGLFTGTDAVILEVWNEELNAFQVPDILIEPALGDVDTTERVRTSMAFRLLNMDLGTPCRDIAGMLTDPVKGKLRVTMQKKNIIPGDCPKFEAGGYTGFEHYLYRIEIADVSPGSAVKFKWSRFNGGLVGRGIFNSANKKISITSNYQAIITSGLNQFYLEAVQYDKQLGHCTVTYGTKASLINNELVLTDPPEFGTFPVQPAISSGSIFFRLWDDIQTVAEFPTASSAPVELRDGIRLEFEPVSQDNYKPGDYWTFKVRSGEIGNNEVLIGKKETAEGEFPHGIEYHRVPLAILNWNGADEISADSEDKPIEDCRIIFPPLTGLPRGGCCVAVKPGENLDLIIKDVIKTGGGCICLMPGSHYITNTIELKGLCNLHISGVGLSTRLYATDYKKIQYFFLLEDADNISFSDFAVFSPGGTDIWHCKNAKNLVIENMFAYSLFLNNFHPIIKITGNYSESWQIRNNIFIAPATIFGEGLYFSSITNNVCISSIRGIYLDSASDLGIEKNRMFGIDAEVSQLDADIDELNGRLEKIDRSAGIINGISNLSNVPDPNLLAKMYTAIEIVKGFDLSITENVIAGRVGVDIDLAENCRITANNFITTLFAANLGLVQGMNFSENKIGIRLLPADFKSAVLCNTGLRILSDAVDCTIWHNDFENVIEGVVFESDGDGKKETIRIITTQFASMKQETEPDEERIIKEAESVGLSPRENQIVRRNKYFKLGKCDRILIDGNKLHCRQTGIEWTGTKNILGFQVRNNFFTGCQDTAIRLEPDDITFLLSDTNSDTNIRLVENNRFEIYAAAFRSTIGKLRFINNNILILPEIYSYPKADLAQSIGTHVLSYQPYTAAVENNDMPYLRMVSKEAETRAAGNPGIVNPKAFKNDYQKKISANYKPGIGNVFADIGHTMMALAGTERIDILTSAAGIISPKVINALEGFAVNISGLNNSVIHNNILSKNKGISGGIVFHLMSGEVRDNQVSVFSKALLMNANIGKSLKQSAEITGNSLKVSGLNAAAGVSTSANSLSITSLTPGQLTITANIFDGPVKIGSDPASSMGFVNIGKFETVPENISYNNLKTEPWLLNFSINTISAGHFLTLDMPYKLKKILSKDPHKDRTIIQFTDNRIMHGFLAVSGSTAGVRWFVQDLIKNASNIPVVNLSDNVIDYGGRIVCNDLIITGNHSQLPVQYRVGNSVEAIANIPQAETF